MSDLRPRHILSVWAVFAIVVSTMFACGAFIGPGTQKTDAFMIHCGAETCDSDGWQCSPPWYPQVHCVSKLASAPHDAGRE